MNTNNLTTLSWSQLMSSNIIGDNILIEYANADSCGCVTSIFQRMVEVLGTAYVGDEHILLVFDPRMDDVYIIKKDGQGYDWDAYKYL